MARKVKVSLKELRRVHLSRPSRARKLDEARLARIPKSPVTWMRHPDKYDWPGIDTPDVAEKRRARAEKLRERMRRLKEKVVSKEVREVNGRWVVIGRTEDGRPVILGSYKSREEALKAASLGRFVKAEEIAARWGEESMKTKELALRILRESGFVDLAERAERDRDGIWVEMPAEDGLVLLSLRAEYPDIRLRKSPT